MAFNNIRDESVRRLAETLRSSGMAASDSEAIRMAEEMSGVANKVQKGYDEQREKPQVSTTNTEDAVQRISEQTIEYDQGEALNETKIPNEDEANSLYAQQAAAISAGMVSSNNTVSGNIVQDEVSSVSQVEQSSQDSSDESVSSNESSEHETMSNEAQSETKEETEPVQEEKERDNSDMAESKIDLSDVFNFGK